MRHRVVCCSTDNRPVLLQPVSRRVDVCVSDVIGRWSPVPLRLRTRSHGYHLRTASDRTLLVRSVLFRRHVHGDEVCCLRLTGCRLGSGRLRQQQDDAPRRGHCGTRARSRTLPCYFGATCTNVDGGSDYQCRCAVGYQGRDCDWYNPCLTTEPPCRHGATCSSPITGEYSCMCAVGQYTESHSIAYSQCFS